MNTPSTNSEPKRPLRTSDLAAAGATPSAEQQEAERRRQAEAAAQASDARRSQVRTVDRSERVRTYNFPENRISDHRVGYKAYNLSAVLDGELDGVLDALITADRAEQLAQ